LGRSALPGVLAGEVVSRLETIAWTALLLGMSVAIVANATTGWFVVLGGFGALGAVMIAAQGLFEDKR
jgi:hypothetical protein